MRVFKYLGLSLAGLISLVALWRYGDRVRVAYSDYERDVKGFMGLEIGASMDEALYAFGYPDRVLGPEGSQNRDGWSMGGIDGKFHAVYYIGGQGAKEDMPAGKSVKDYYEWGMPLDGKGVDVAFDPKAKRVTKIRCFRSFSSRIVNCPPIFGITTGISEGKLREILGAEDAVKYESGIKVLNYDALGLQVELSKRTVVSITKSAPRGTSEWQWKLWHLWL